MLEAFTDIELSKTEVS
jgi:hypothetical protein